MRKKLATKICAIAMTATMVAGLAGCGNDPADTPSGSGSSGGGSSQGSEENPGGQDTPDDSQEEEEKYDFGGKTVRVSGGIFGNLNEESKLDDEGNVKVDYTNARDLADQLEQKYNIKIEYVSLQADDGYTTDQAILAGITSGECYADIFTCSDDLVLGLRDYMAEITDDVDKLKLGSIYVTPGTWQGHVYGWTYDNMGSSYVLVYSRAYLDSIGMKETPTDKFMKGEWSYTDCIDYLTELKAKLPDGTYPISVHPNHWSSMAPGANGVVSVDSDGGVHLGDEAYISSLEFYTQLLDLGLAAPVTKAEINENGGISMSIPYGMGDMCGPTEAKGYVLTMVEAWQYGDMQKNVGDWGIVPWPWDENYVTCEGDYTTLSDTYLVPQSIWTDVVVPKAEYRAADAKDIPDIVLHMIARDFCDLSSPRGAAARTGMWEAESKGEPYENYGYTPGDPGHFSTTEDIEVFDWLHTRSVTDWGHAFSENGIVRVFRNAQYVIGARRDARSTADSMVQEAETTMKDMGYK